MVLRDKSRDTQTLSGGESAGRTHVLLQTLTGGRSVKVFSSTDHPGPT